MYIGYNDNLRVDYKIPLWLAACRLNTLLWCFIYSLADSHISNPDNTKGGGGGCRPVL